MIGLSGLPNPYSYASCSHKLSGVIHGAPMNNSDTLSTQEIPRVLEVTSQKPKQWQNLSLEDKCLATQTLATCTVCLA